MVKYLDNKSEKKESKFSFFTYFLIFVISWIIFSYIFPQNKNNKSEGLNDSEKIEVSTVKKSYFENDKISFEVSSGQISNINLKDYKESKKSDEKVILVKNGGFVEFGLIGNIEVPSVNTIWNCKNINNSFLCSYKNKQGVLFERLITNDSYLITVKDKVINKMNKDILISNYSSIVDNLDLNNSVNSNVSVGAVAYINEDLEVKSLKKIDDKNYIYNTTKGFIGFMDQYFGVISSISSLDQTVSIKKINDRYKINTISSNKSIKSGDSKEFITNIYVGPRDNEVLSNFTKNIDGIDNIVDYGWFWFLSYPMLLILNLLNNLVGSYGIAIILFTILLRIFISPLTKKSYKSMANMQKMQPEMEKIQKLYAGDKMRMQMELMKLYQSNKTSPMSGCLPMLLQIPIFFALYKALLISVPMRHAEFLWIMDLSSMDKFFILPIFMGITIWWQQKIQSNQSNSSLSDIAKSTQKITKWMPVIFTIMFSMMPAGLVLYWIVSNLCGIAQIYLIKRKM